MSQFSFGSNPGTGTSTGLTFATPKAAAPAFGTLGTSQPSGSITFGTPIASAAPNVQNPGLQLAPTLGGGLNFATPAKTTGLAFGTPPSTSGLSFGTSASAPGLSYGAPPGSTAPTLAFGTNTTSVAPVLSFGTPATSGGLSFGATPIIGLGHASAASTTPGLFSIPASSAPTLGGLKFGTNAPSGFPVGVPAATVAPILNYGTGLAGSLTSTAPTLNFKSPVAPTANTTLNFGFSSQPKLQITTNLTPATITTPSVGLGGVDTSQTKIGVVTTGRPLALAVKENPVPNEILQSIESFKQFVKDQKTHSSDVSRGSARPFLKIGEDIDLLNSILSEVGNELERNQQQADKLKHDSAKCLHNAEMAQRTNDTPPGLQFENAAPTRYFIDLVNQFEQDLQALRLQIDITDKHFQSLHEQRFLSSQELSVGMRKLHETFVALAGRLHAVHTQVEAQKEQYLNLRKYILKDPTNIFKKTAKQGENDINNIITGPTSNKSVSGPTPFSSFGTPFGLNMTPAQQITSKPPPAYSSNPPSLRFGASSANFLGSSSAPQDSSLFGGTSTLGQSQDASGFQLQSPPIGNKRGKR